MGTEIERKFLVTGSEWKRYCAFALSSGGKEQPAGSGEDRLQGRLIGLDAARLGPLNRATALQSADDAAGMDLRDADRLGDLGKAKRKRNLTGFAAALLRRQNEFRDQRGDGFLCAKCAELDHAFVAQSFLCAQIFEQAVVRDLALAEKGPQLLLVELA